MSFSLQDSSIAEVDENGVVTALKPGSTKIIIEALCDDQDGGDLDNKKAMCYSNVK